MIKKLILTLSAITAWTFAPTLEVVRMSAEPLCAIEFDTPLTQAEICRRVSLAAKVPLNLTQVVSSNGKILHPWSAEIFSEEGILNFVAMTADCMADVEEGETVYPVDHMRIKEELVKWKRITITSDKFPGVKIFVSLFKKEIIDDLLGPNLLRNLIPRLWTLLEKRKRHLRNCEINFNLYDDIKMKFSIKLTLYDRDSLENFENSIVFNIFYKEWFEKNIKPEVNLDSFEDLSYAVQSLSYPELDKARREIQADVDENFPSKTDKALIFKTTVRDEDMVAWLVTVCPELMNTASIPASPE